MANPLGEWMGLHHIARRHGMSPLIVHVQCIASLLNNGELEQTLSGWVAFDDLGGFMDISDLDQDGFISTTWVWLVGHVVVDADMSDWLLLRVNIRRLHRRIARAGG